MPSPNFDIQKSAPGPVAYLIFVDYLTDISTDVISACSLNTEVSAINQNTTGVGVFEDAVVRVQSVIMLARRRSVGPIRHHD